ncbi:hypothetical protein OAS39_02135 [Pirellulales bacterium]|nr:hypothetical protein [Pirellulales bacterium]
MAHRYYLRNANQQVQATRLKGMSGGEGYLCAISGRTDASLKILDPPPPDLEPRLQFMIANPPHSILGQLAWPLDIVEDDCGRVVGYLQRHFPSRQTLTVIADSSSRPPWATDAEVCRFAAQAAAVIAELSAHDYLFPDLHPDQFLVAQGHDLALIDTGGCQFQVGAQFFPCHKVRPEYQAPELLALPPGSDAVARQRSVYTDAYSLALVIFNLIMRCPPYAGVYVGTGTPTTAAERARRGVFPFDPACQDYRPPPTAPPYRDVDDEVKEFFRKCFVDGAANPMARPTAEHWAGMLRHLSTLSSRRAAATVSPNRAPTSPAVPTKALGPPSARAYVNVAAAALLLLGAGAVGTWLDAPFQPPSLPAPAPITNTPWTADMISPGYPTSGVDIAPALERFRRQTAQRKASERPFSNQFRP